MRIVAGRFRGRGLVGPEGRGEPGAIRPTSDRLRETVFNILAHAYDDPVTDARVLDLFAGTGALGLEALSRGARFVQFVETGTDARALIRANVEALGVGGSTRILRRDATALGAAPPGEPFGLAFLDPPYGLNLAPRALSALAEGNWLMPDALCVVEERAETALAVPSSFAILDERSQGDSRVHFLQRRP